MNLIKNKWDIPGKEQIQTMTIQPGLNELQKLYIVIGEIIEELQKHVQSNGISEAESSENNFSAEDFLISPGNRKLLKLMEKHKERFEDIQNMVDQI